MQKPDGYLWEYPGIPSLFVLYYQTNDFFYSGHVGSCILVGLEAHAKGIFWLEMFAWFGTLVQTLVMIFLRGHYFIDLVAGAVFAHYFFLLSNRYCYIVDRLVCGLETKEPKDERERGFDA